jgi:uncharacterized membrane protein
MKKLVRCKACGYTLEEAKLGDKCPACGAAKISFMPYADPMSQARRNVLKLDLHPIAVHFPISLTVAVLVFSLAAVFLSGDAHLLLRDTVKILVLLVPVLVVIAGVVGYFDGKIRFRKIKNSLILKRKILYASLFFVVSAVMAVVVWVFNLNSVISNFTVIVLGLIAVGLIVILSRLGTSITEAAFPG